MNTMSPERKPKWDWVKWLADLCAAKGYRPRKDHTPMLLRRYRVYIDQSCSMFLGDVASTGGFYSVFESACSLFLQYADTITIIDADTGWAM